MIDITDSHQKDKRGGDMNGKEVCVWEEGEGWEWERRGALYVGEINQKINSGKAVYHK